MIELYKNLMKLCNNNDCFHYRDHKSIAGGLYRIFGYRIASYNDFLADDALHCRGIMFEIKEDGTYVRVASRPMHKFFNAFENPFTMFDDHTIIETVYDKLDGSMINTFIDVDGKLYCKSHESLSSDHAILANKLLRNDKDLYNEIYLLATNGYTVNMELTSTKLRIVLPYQEDKLTILNIVCNETGYIFEPDNYEMFGDIIYRNSVKKVVIKNNSLKNFYDEVKKQTNFEGYIVKTTKGVICKIKTDWYCMLHANKSSIGSDKQLFNLALNNKCDDLRQLFLDDQFVQDRISLFESVVSKWYNKLQKQVDEFYNKFKNLSKKEYALQLQADLTKNFGLHVLAFNKFDNKVTDKNLQYFMLKQYQDILLEEGIINANNDCN